MQAASPVAYNPGSTLYLPFYISDLSKKIDDCEVEQQQPTSSAYLVGIPLTGDIWISLCLRTSRLVELRSILVRTTRTYYRSSGPTGLANPTFIQYVFQKPAYGQAHGFNASFDTFPHIFSKCLQLVQYDKKQRKVKILLCWVFWSFTQIPPPNFLPMRLQNHILAVWISLHNYLETQMRCKYCIDSSNGQSKVIYEL